MDAAEFLQQLRTAALVVENDHPVEILRNFCFRNGYVRGYNRTSGVIAKCQFPLECCLRADRLMQIFGALSGEVTIKQQDTKLVFKNGGNTTKLNTADWRSFPDAMPVEKKPLCDGGNLAESISKVLTFLDNEGSTLSCVGIKGDRIYATDGNRAAMARLSAAIPATLQLPKSSARHIVKLGSPKNLLLGGETLLAVYPELGAIYLTAQTAPKFPFAALADMFSSPEDRSLSVQIPADLPQVVSRVLCLVPKSGRATKEIQLINSDAGLQVSFTEREVGESTEIVAWDFKRPFSVKLNAAYMQEALRHSEYINLSSVFSRSPKSVRFYAEDCDFLVAIRV